LNAGGSIVCVLMDTVGFVIRRRDIRAHV